MQLVIFANGLICALMGALMLIPAAAGPQAASPFLIGAFLATMIGATICTASRRSPEGFAPRHAFVLTTSAWVTAALSASLPLQIAGMTFTDAFFESMSGLTTTGSTVMSGLDRAPVGILIWRAMLQWIGGIGIIVTGIAALPILRVGGMQLFRTESSDTGEKELASAANFAAATIWVYLGLSVACAAAYAAGGMSSFDAILHAMTTVSTGGYSTHDASMGYFDDPAIQWTAVVFMLCGALPFAWHLRVIRKGLWRSEQVRVFLLSMAAIVLMLTAWEVIENDEPTLKALREAAFNAVSVVTTTGYAAGDYTTWGAAPAAVFVIITFFGGCTGSTAGGFKAMRLIVASKALAAAVLRIQRPHRLILVRFEGRVVDDAALSSIVAFSTFFLLTFALLAMTLCMLGLDVSTAITGAATALANVGPGIGETIGPAGTFAPLSDAAKWVLATGMLLGRLEVMTVLALLTAGVLRP